jgi:hypothetical protein
MLSPNSGAADSFNFDHEILLSFDIDCGELAHGHRVRVTGLSDHGFSRNDLTSQEQKTTCRMVALEYDLVPGVHPDEVVDGFDERFLVQAAYHADVELPWTTAGVGGIGPGEIELFAGGDRTHGALGPWPVPEAARTLTFVLYRPPARRDLTASIAGAVVVNLAERSAGWTPADQVPL